MSYTEMFLVPQQGEIQFYAEFHNSHGGAAYVWDKLSDKYLRWTLGEWLMADDEKIKRLWHLNKDPRLTPEERIVLTTTFDGIMVKREDLLAVAQAFEFFAQLYGPGTHLPQQAEKLRELYADPDCYAVCWNQTSVNADTWWVLEGEEHRRYDISRDEDQHWFLDIKELEL